MKKKKLKYVVIFDSSVVYGKPIRKEIVELIKNCLADKRLSISFYAPEMVLDEAKRHLFEDLLDLKNEYDAIIKDIGVILKKQKFPELIRSESKIFTIVAKAFSDNNIAILNTPDEKISWKDVAKKAAYKRTPFSPEKDKEKGFKDAVIAETIFIALPKLSKNSHVVVLCHDSRLAEYIESRTKRYKNVKIFPSVPDFESAMRLHLLKNDDKLIEEITREAESSFYKALDETSLFYKENLRKRIQESYPTLFANPIIKDNLYYGVRVWNESVKTNWIPVSEPEYRVTKPVFMARGGENIYKWESTVKYRQVFENEPTIRNSSLMGFDNRGELALEFKIKWESEVDSRGKINPSSRKITSIEHIPGATGLLFGQEGTAMASLATSAGQGTVSVAFNPYPFSDSED